MEGGGWTLPAAVFTSSVAAAWGLKLLRRQHWSLLNARDCLGCPLRTCSRRCVNACNEYFLEVLSYGPHWEVALSAIHHDPNCVMAAIVVCDYLLNIEVDAEQAKLVLEQARELVTPYTTTRERHYISAYSALLEGDLIRAAGFLRGLLAEHPTDLFALKRAQLITFIANELSTMLTITLETYPHNQNTPYFHGMLAFAYEQRNEFQLSEEHARLGIQLCPRDSWSHHALAHVLYATGRFQQGVDEMTPLAYIWEDCMPFMLTHNWFHMCLFHLELCEEGGEPERKRLVAAFEQHVWTDNTDKSNVQVQLGALNILAKCVFRGINDLDRHWQDVAEHIESSGGVERCKDRLFDVLAVYGLRRAGRIPLADQLLYRIRQDGGCMSHTGAVLPVSERETPSELGYVTLAEGLAQLADKKFEKAAELLSIGQQHAGSVGGSNEQRDVLEEALVHAYLSIGSSKALKAALDILQQRDSERNGAFPFIRNLLADVQTACASPGDRIPSAKLRSKYFQAMRLQ